MSESFGDVLEREQAREDAERKAKKDAAQAQIVMQKYAEAKKLIKEVEGGRFKSIGVEVGKES